MSIKNPFLTKQWFIYFTYRLIIAFLAAFIIVIHGQNDVLKLFYLPYFYTSVLKSAVIAIILIEIVYQVTLYLNIKDDGFVINRQRLVKQFFLGFFIPGILAFMLADVLFRLHDIDILKTIYFSELYPLILLGIFCLNIFYLLYYEVQFKKVQIIETIQVIRTVETVHKVIERVEFVEKIVEKPVISIEEHVVPGLIYTSEKEYWALNLNGTRIVWTDDISTSIGKLDKKHYFQNGRGQIIARHVIKEYETLASKNLRIIPTFETSIEIRVSRCRAKAFRDWLKGDDRIN